MVKLSDVQISHHHGGFGVLYARPRARLTESGQRRPQRMIAMRHTLTPTIDVLLAETLRQITAARQTIVWLEGNFEPLDDNISRLDVVRDCTCVTARLTSVLSWLLIQRAVAAGEVAIDDKRACRPLFGVGDARVDPSQPFAEVGARPEAVSRMLAESAALFAHIARLDRSREAQP